MIKIIIILLLLSFISILAPSCKTDGTFLSPSDKDGEQKPPSNLSYIRTELDLDSNSIVDYILEYATLITTDEPPSGSTHFLEIVPQDSNKVNFKLYEGSLPLEFGTLINNDLEWGEYPSNLARINWSISSGWDSVWTGPWSGVNGKYLAVQFKINDFFHFGWLKISVKSNTGEYVVHEYSYNPELGKEIKAGER